MTDLAIIWQSKLIGWAIFVRGNGPIKFVRSGEDPHSKAWSFPIAMSLLVTNPSLGFLLARNPFHVAPSPTTSPSPSPSPSSSPSPSPLPLREVNTSDLVDHNSSKLVPLRGKSVPLQMEAEQVSFVFKKVRGACPDLLRGAPVLTASSLIPVHYRASVLHVEGEIHPNGDEVLKERNRTQSRPPLRVHRLTLSPL